MAIGAQEQGLVVGAAQNPNFEALATGAAGGGLARLRLIRLDCGLMVKAAGFLGIQLEGAAAISANVVEAALGLAGVDNVAAAALRAADDVLQSLHTGILAITAHVYTVGTLRPWQFLTRAPSLLR